MIAHTSWWFPPQWTVVWLTVLRHKYTSLKWGGCSPASARLVVGPAGAASLRQPAWALRNLVRSILMAFKLKPTPPLFRRRRWNVAGLAGPPNSACAGGCSGQTRAAAPAPRPSDLSGKARGSQGRAGVWDGASRQQSIDLIFCSVESPETRRTIRTWRKFLLAEKKLRAVLLPGVVWGTKFGANSFVKLYLRRNSGRLKWPKQCVFRQYCSKWPSWHCTGAFRGEHLSKTRHKRFDHGVRTILRLRVPEPSC